MKPIPATDRTPTKSGLFGPVIGEYLLRQSLSRLARIATSALIWLSLLGTLSLARGIERPAAPGHGPSAQDNIAIDTNTAAAIELLKDWSLSKLSLESPWGRAESVQATIDMLKRNPGEAVPGLLRVFVDKNQGRQFRINCAEVLSQTRTNPGQARYKWHLLKIVRDNTEEALIRVFSAQLLLRDKSLPSSAKSEIMELMDSFIEKGLEKAYIRMSIMPELAGEPGAVRIMLKELARGGEPGPTLSVLGKLRGRAAVGPIAEMLDLEFNNPAFPRTRAYLALGEIGGGRAYDLLRRYLDKEPDVTKRHIIVRAIGLTRDPRAKTFLLSNISSPQDEFFTSALRGLKYLGDRSVLPTLQHWLNSDISEHQRFTIKTTIQCLATGDSAPDW